MTAVAILFALLAAEAPTTSPVLATFETRHQWPWPGAIYDLTLRENGTVEYVGKECVAVKGRRVVQLESSEFAKLRAWLETVNPERTTCCTDIADSVAIGRAHIQMCCSDRYGRRLFALQTRVVELTGAAPWIGKAKEQPGCGENWRLAHLYHRGQITFVQGGKRQTWVLAEGFHFPLSAPTKFELSFVPAGEQGSDGELIAHFTSDGVTHVKVTSGPAGNWTLLEYDGASCDLDMVNADDQRVEAIGHCQDAKNAAALAEFDLEAVK